MELGHAYSVLVVSASAKFNESVRGLLPERFYWPVTVLTDAAGARREPLENSCDLEVINTPLPAISDAIYNAIGTRFYELPITPEQIAMAAAENHK